MFHFFLVRPPHDRAPRARLVAVLALTLVACVTITTTSALQAQPAAESKAADPLDPSVRVPALAYESSLVRAKQPTDEAPVSWRQANDNVTRIGGWRVYAREAQQPDAAPAVATPPAAVTAPAAKPATPAATTPAVVKPMHRGGHGGHKSP